MEEYNIKFSKDELIALLQLIDIAVQSKGLQVAEVAVYFNNKIKQATLNIEGIDNKKE
jgi:hypothetical protein